MRHLPSVPRIVPSVALLAGALLTSCAVGPDYRRPAPEVPTAFKEAAPGADPAAKPDTTPDAAAWRQVAPKDDLPKGAWWTIYQDPALDRLAARATAASPTVAAAVARRDQARWVARAAGAAEFPSVALDASATRARTPPNSRTGSPASTGNSFSLPIDLGYELDLWGRVRRTREAAGAQAEAADADYHNVLLGVQADVVRGYFSLRALDVERALLARTADSRRRSLAITARQVALGAAAQLDASLAEADLATAEGDLAALDQNRAAVRHGLAVLCGELPESTDFADPTSAAAPAALIEPPAIPLGLPSELLERRPDVASAERALAAANAQIGVAQAAFYPVVTLTGSFGFSSATAGSLLHWDNRLWSFGPGVSLPLFQGGRNRAELERAKAAHAEAVATYRLGVLTAFQEVETALSDVHRLAERAGHVARAEVAARRAADLVRERYKAGQVGYLDVTDAERTALANERLAVQVRGLQLVASVVLVKALGGGW